MVSPAAGTGAGISVAESADTIAGPELKKSWGIGGWRREQLKVDQKKNAAVSPIGKFYCLCVAVAICKTVS